MITRTAGIASKDRSSRSASKCEPLPSRSFSSALSTGKAFRYTRFVVSASKTSAIAEEGFEVGEVVVPQRVSFRSSRFASAGSTLDNGSR